MPYCCKVNEKNLPTHPSVDSHHCDRDYKSPGDLILSATVLLLLSNLSLFLFSQPLVTQFVGGGIGGHSKWQTTFPGSVRNAGPFASAAATTTFSALDSDWSSFLGKIYIVSHDQCCQIYGYHRLLEKQNESLPRSLVGYVIWEHEQQGNHFLLAVVTDEGRGFMLKTTATKRGSSSYSNNANQGISPAGSLCRYNPTPRQSEFWGSSLGSSLPLWLSDNNNDKSSLMVLVSPPNLAARSSNSPTPLDASRLSKVDPVSWIQCELSRLVEDEASDEQTGGKICSLLFLPCKQLKRTKQFEKIAQQDLNDFHADEMHHHHKGDRSWTPTTETHNLSHTVDPRGDCLIPAEAILGPVLGWRRSMKFVLDRQQSFGGGMKRVRKTTALLVVNKRKLIIRSHREAWKWFGERSLVVVETQVACHDSCLKKPHSNDHSSPLGMLLMTSSSFLPLNKLMMLNRRTYCDHDNNNNYDDINNNSKGINCCCGLANDVADERHSLAYEGICKFIKIKAIGDRRAEQTRQKSDDDQYEELERVTFHGKDSLESSKMGGKQQQRRDCDTKIMMNRPCGRYETQGYDKTSGLTSPGATVGNKCSMVIKKSHGGGQSRKFIFSPGDIKQQISTSPPTIGAFVIDKQEAEDFSVVFSYLVRSFKLCSSVFSALIKKYNEQRRIIILAEAHAVEMLLVSPKNSNEIGETTVSKKEKLQASRVTHHIPLVVQYNEPLVQSKTNGPQTLLANDLDRKMIRSSSLWSQKDYWLSSGNSDHIEGFERSSLSSNANGRDQKNYVDEPWRASFLAHVSTEIRSANRVQSMSTDHQSKEKEPAQGLEVKNGSLRTVNLNTSKPEVSPLPSLVASDCLKSSAATSATAAAGAPNCLDKLSSYRGTNQLNESKSVENITHRKRGKNKTDQPLDTQRRVQYVQSSGQQAETRYAAMASCFVEQLPPKADSEGAIYPPTERNCGSGDEIWHKYCHITFSSDSSQRSPSASRDVEGDGRHKLMDEQKYEREEGKDLMAIEWPNPWSLPTPVEGSESEEPEAVCCCQQPSLQADIDWLTIQQTENNNDNQLVGPNHHYYHSNSAQNSSSSSLHSQQQQQQQQQHQVLGEAGKPPGVSSAHLNRWAREGEANTTSEAHTISPSPFNITQAKVLAPITTTDSYYINYNIVNPTHTDQLEAVHLQSNNKPLKLPSIEEAVGGAATTILANFSTSTITNTPDNYNYSSSSSSSINSNNNIIINYQLDHQQPSLTIHHLPIDHDHSTGITSTTSTITTSRDMIEKSSHLALPIALILGLIISITFVGNVLVCLSVIRVRKLRHPSNYLLISLAISDLCVACIVMPFGLYQSINDKWQLGRLLCNVYVVSDVTSCTASILNLCVISIDRYLAITRPLTYCVKRTTRLMMLLIAAVWICACLISVTPLLISGNEYGTLEEPRCEVSQSLWYQLYATCISFYIPLIVMICLYYNIYMAAKRVVEAEQRATTGLHVSNNANRKDSNVNIAIESGNNIALNDGITGDESGARGSQQMAKSSTGNPKASLKSSTVSAIQSSLSFGNHLRGSSGTVMLNNNNNNNNTQQQANHHPHGGGTSPTSTPNSSSTRTSSVMRERKASITLGVIMSAFTICWLPFFIIALLRPFSETVNNLPRTFVLLTLWLGYANSLLNPIIYVTFHHDFRNAFKHLLCLRCMTINEHIRKDEYKSQYGETHYQENIRKMRSQQQQLLTKKVNQLP